MACYLYRPCSATSCIFLYFVFVFFFFFFFFQAEDGIRDLYVTGVQTCALPILTGSPRPAAGRPRHGELGEPRPFFGGRMAQEDRTLGDSPTMKALPSTRVPQASLAPYPRACQIGRASCRERV